MDYLNYAAEFQPMSVLPSDRLSIDEELATIPVPTVRLDTKRALPYKQNEEPVKYSTYWGSQKWFPQVQKTGIKEAYKQFVTSWEGGRLTNTPGDRGGLTNNGITIGTWRTVGKDKNGDGKIDEKDLALMTQADHDSILEERFWNAARADEIYNPYLAAYVVDWMWGSGPGAFKKMHEAMGLKPQSKMTQQLLDHLNRNPNEAFNNLYNARIQFYKNIVARDSSQKKFLKGWIRRANAITLNGMTLNQ